MRKSNGPAGSRTRTNLAVQRILRPGGGSVTAEAAGVYGDAAGDDSNTDSTGFSAWLDACPKALNERERAIIAAVLGL